MERKLRGNKSINIGVTWGGSANAPPIFFYLTIVFLFS
jgi:hypothetical protein